MDFVSEHYFLSPKYNLDSKNEKTVQGDEGPYQEWDSVFDERDVMDAWLNENSLGPVENRAKMSHNLRHHLFMGEEGVLCEICISDALHERGSELVRSMSEREGMYRRLIKIRQMPSNKRLPRELLEQINRYAEYSRVTSSDKSVKVAGLE